MQEKGFMWDSVNSDRQYGSQDMADAFNGIVSDGVVDADNDFLITILDASAGIVRIGSGQAWIGGRTLKLDGYEDITLPRHGTQFVGGITWDSLIVLKARTNVENRDFAFECKLYNLDTNEYPQLGAGEILVGKFLWRRVGSLDGNNMKREVSKANAKNNKVDTATDTDITGLLKGKAGKVMRALPQEDYMPATGGALYADIVPTTGYINGVPYMLPAKLGRPESKFGAVYSEFGLFDVIELNNVGIASLKSQLGIGKQIWPVGGGTGSWNSGNITVPEFGNYTVYMIGMATMGTRIFAMKATQYLRGNGGYAPSANEVTSYQFTATYLGNVLTFIACNSMSHISGGSHDVAKACTVNAIYGLI